MPHELFVAVEGIIRVKHINGGRNTLASLLLASLEMASTSEDVGVKETLDLGSITAFQFAEAIRWKDVNEVLCQLVRSTNGKSDVVDAAEKIQYLVTKGADIDQYVERLPLILWAFPEFRIPLAQEGARCAWADILTAQSQRWDYMTGKFTGQYAFQRVGYSDVCVRIDDHEWNAILRARPGWRFYCCGAACS